MAIIHGDLDMVGIAPLLQLLAQNGSAGLLHVTLKDAQKQIEVGPPGMRLLSGDRRTNPLGEILVRSGKISVEKLHGLLVEAHVRGRRLGELVVDHGIITQEVLDFALREQLAEEIFDLFTWTGASFSFSTEPGAVEDVDRGPLASVTLDFKHMSLMIEAARRVDELTRIQAAIPDHRLVPQQIELPARLDDPTLDHNAVEEILPLADGKRSIEEIVDVSFYSKFTVLRTLYGLSLQGAIKIRDRRASRGPQTVIHHRPSGAPGPRPSAAVLVVSPLDSFRSALAFSLRTASHRPVEASDPEIARAVLAAQAFDLIVLDLALETEEGIEFCLKVRGDSKAPMLLLSDSGGRPAVGNALRSGADCILVKPLMEDIFLQRIHKILESAPAGAAGLESPHERPLEPV